MSQIDAGVTQSVTNVPGRRVTFNNIQGVDTSISFSDSSDSITFNQAGSYEIAGILRVAYGSDRASSVHITAKLNGSNAFISATSDHEFVGDYYHTWNQTITANAGDVLHFESWAGSGSNSATIFSDSYLQVRKAATSGFATLTLSSDINSSTADQLLPFDGFSGDSSIATFNSGSNSITIANAGNYRLYGNINSAWSSGNYFSNSKLIVRINGAVQNDLLAYSTAQTFSIPSVMLNAGDVVDFMYSDHNDGPSWNGFVGPSPYILQAGTTVNIEPAPALCGTSTSPVVNFDGIPTHSNFGLDYFRYGGEDYIIAANYDGPTELFKSDGGTGWTSVQADLPNLRGIAMIDTVGGLPRFVGTDFASAQIYISIFEWDAATSKFKTTAIDRVLSVPTASPTSVHSEKLRALYTGGKTIITHSHAGEGTELARQGRVYIFSDNTTTIPTPHLVGLIGRGVDSMAFIGSDGGVYVANAGYRKNTSNWMSLYSVDVAAETLTQINVQAGGIHFGGAGYLAFTSGGKNWTLSVNHNGAYHHALFEVDLTTGNFTNTGVTFPLSQTFFAYDNNGTTEIYKGDYGDNLEKYTFDPVAVSFTLVGGAPIYTTTGVIDIKSVTIDGNNYGLIGVNSSAGSTDTNSLVIPLD